MKTVEKTLIVLSALALTAGCVAPGAGPSSNSPTSTASDGGGVQNAPADNAAPSATPQSTAARVLERPVNTVGDECYYDRTIGNKKMRETRKLSILTPEKMVWEIQTDTGLKGTLELNVVDSGYETTKDVAWANGQIITLTPGYRWIAFPAQPGQAHTVKSQIKGETFEGSVVDDVKVEKWEKVKVPAGEFDALRTSIKSQYRDINKTSVRGNMSLWNSPGTKCMLVELKYTNSAGEKGHTKLVGWN